MFRTTLGAVGGSGPSFRASFLCQEEVDGRKTLLHRPGSITPLLLGADCGPDQDFRGRLEIRMADEMFAFGPPQVHAIHLPANSCKLLRYYLDIPLWATKVQIRVASQDPEALLSVSYDVQHISTSRTVVVVVDETGNLRSFFPESSLGGGAFLVFPCLPANLPDRLEGLSAVDLLVLGDFQADTLPWEIRRAVLSWVRMGGTVFLDAAGGLRRLRSPLCRDLLTIDLKPASTVADLSRNATGPVPLPSGSAPLVGVTESKGTVLLRADERPFLLSIPLALGRVLFCTADLSAPLFLTWSDRDRFADGLRRWTAPSLTRSLDGLLEEAVLPGVFDKWIFPLLCFIAAYVFLFLPLAAGAFLHAIPPIFLRAFSPLVVVTLGVIVSIVAAPHLLDDRVFFTRLVVYRSAASSTTAVAEERLALTAGSRATVTVFDGDNPFRFSEPYRTRRTFGAGMEVPMAALVEASAKGTRRLALFAGMPVHLRRRSMVEIGPVHVDLIVTARADTPDPHVEGQVDNRSDTALEGTVFFFGQYCFELGRVPAGGIYKVWGTLRPLDDHVALSLLDADLSRIDPTPFKITRLDLPEQERPLEKKILDAIVHGCGEGIFKQIGEKVAQGPGLLLARVPAQMSPTPVRPAPLEVASWALRTITCTVTIRSDGVYFPWPALPWTWLDKDGRPLPVGPDGPQQFTADGRLRCESACDIMQSVRFPLPLSSFSNVVYYMRPPTQFQSYNVDCFVYDWVAKTWEEISRSPGFLDSSRMQSLQGEVRFLFRVKNVRQKVGMDPGEDDSMVLLDPVRLDGYGLHMEDD
jgi:hypothetical protein